MTTTDDKRPIPPELSEAARLMRAMRRTKPKGPALSKKKRCPCGKHTLRRARARNFDCCRRAGGEARAEAYRLWGRVDEQMGAAEETHQ